MLQWASLADADASSREMVGNVAVDCGYFDQSHTNRNFQEFSGLTPGAYHSQWSEHVLPHHAIWIGSIFSITGIAC
jgi:hypothetical protein